VTIAAVFAYF